MADYRHLCFFSFSLFPQISSCLYFFMSRVKTFVAFSFSSFPRVKKSRNGTKTDNIIQTSVIFLYNVQSFRFNDQNMSPLKFKCCYDRSSAHVYTAFDRAFSLYTQTAMFQYSVYRRMLGMPRVSESLLSFNTSPRACLFLFPD